MENLIAVIVLLGTLVSTQNSKAQIVLDKNVFRNVPFSSQYSEDGSLIRSVDFRSVNDLIPQIEMAFERELNGQKLQDRNESHITVITPPEGKTGFFPGNVGIDSEYPTSEMISDYKNILQTTEFDIVCLGMQSNDKGNIVFYLVVESKDIMNIRSTIEEKVKGKNPNSKFSANENYYPHITIGFVGGDVFGVSKGTDTCVADVVVR
jgi:2'-5' RNA ligase